MQSERQPARPPPWAVGASTGEMNGNNLPATSLHTDDDFSPIMSATAGPGDPNDFYWPGKHGSPGSSPLEESAKPLPDLSGIGRGYQRSEMTPRQEPSSPTPSPYAHAQTSLRSASHSPAPRRYHNASPSAAGQNQYTYNQQQQQPQQSPGLNSMRSTPVLLPSRPVGSVRNIASRFNQGGPDTARTSQDRYRRPVANSKSRSPIRKSPSREAGTKLQKKKQSTKTPAQSHAHAALFSSSIPTPQGQSHAKSAAASYAYSRPLFGEITSDGVWNGNFNLDLYNNTAPVTNRRSSDAAANGLRRGRTQSQQDLTFSASFESPQVGHRRSRSDMDAWGQPSLYQNYQHPTFTSQDLPIMHPPPLQQPQQQQQSSNSESRIARPKTPTTSRIPVSTHRLSDLSASSPRSASAASQHSRTSTNNGKENALPSAPTSPASRNRYHQRPPLSPRNSHTLAAQIVAPPPATSPRLRSSRPRQPVSSATTAASRARAARHFDSSASASPSTSSLLQQQQAQSQNPRDGSTARLPPSEQWLGKPYDPKQERSKRNIPKLVDFAERRARIQKAISQNLAESRSLESLRSRSQSRSRKSSERNLREKTAEAEAGTLPSTDDADEDVDGERSQTPLAAASSSGDPVEQLANVSDAAVAMPGTWPLSPGFGSRQTGLSLDTGIAASSSTPPNHPAAKADLEPMTAHTEFEDESPVLGRNSEEVIRDEYRYDYPQHPQQQQQYQHQQQQQTPESSSGPDTPVLLSAATYRGSSPFAASGANTPQKPAVSSLQPPNQPTSQSQTQTPASRPTDPSLSAAKLAPVPFSPVTEASAEDDDSQRDSTLLDSVMQMRRLHTPSVDDENSATTEYAPDTPVAAGGERSSVVTDDSADAGSYALQRSMGEKGSIRIMLQDGLQDDHHHHHHHQDFHAGGATGEDNNYGAAAYRGLNSTHHHQLNGSHLAQSGFIDSPSTDDNNDDDVAYPNEEALVTPRKNTAITRGDSQMYDDDDDYSGVNDGNGAHESQDSISRLLHEYRSTGSLSAEKYEEMQRQMVDLQRASANGASNGFMIQSLLDSIEEIGAINAAGAAQGGGRNGLRNPSDDPDIGGPFGYGLPPVTPDTPPGWRPGEESGTATVFHSESSYSLPNALQHSEAGEDGNETAGEDEDDFAAKIRRADEAWERQQRGLGLSSSSMATEDEGPTPPPKDPRYSSARSSSSLADVRNADLSEGLRISGAGAFEVSSALDATGFGDASVFEGGNKRDSRLRTSLSTPALMQPNPNPNSNPPPPAHAPPAPPSANASPSIPQVGVSEKAPQIPASLFESANSEKPPLPQRPAYAHSSSSRPSVDSQRAPQLLPESVSASTLADSTTRQTSLDTVEDGTPQTKSSPNPGTALSPEQKRLSKRRHVIRELLDTENTYHQDLKIIEDIYRATATPDLVSAEDKKILFGNCDDVERFSLRFYDELRQAAASIYVPAKSNRWLGKRGSYSTTQSDGAGQPSSSSDPVDEEKDRGTTIGKAFLDNLPAMEQVYSAYLRNHEAANRRLTALRNTSTVKCWLDECHNNASDITTAWDLDSLLVKPTQRVAKYPMLLTQLLETTTPTHPDRESLSMAVQASVAMLTRINEAKKRADLVDQIVNRKGKDTDVRSGLAKAFGRRTEKLKERVGMAEAFQDPEFDELAHKFGGHFIRLQICMRDVQDYNNRIDKAIDQINGYAAALDNFTDFASSSLTEVQSKWRKYGQVIREVTAIAFAEHRGAVAKRVIGPMIACIKLHDGPQSAISKRKKRIIDYAKCKSLEKRGEKPDKKTVEAAEMYEALNEQLKLDLPRLYTLTANLVQGCLSCFLEIQLKWYNTWERKLRPILDAVDIPASIDEIEPAFRPDYELVKNRTLELGICNGALLGEIANYLSPSTTLVNESEPSSAKASFSLEGSRRTFSMGSDHSPALGSYAFNRRSSSGQGGGDALPMASNDGRTRSTSSLSANRGTTPVLAQSSSGMLSNRPWSNGPHNQSSHSYRPDTSASASASLTPTTHPHHSYSGYASPRRSIDQHSSRPASGSTYYTAQPSSGGVATPLGSAAASAAAVALNPSNNQSHHPNDNAFRFSGIFSSAMPPSDHSHHHQQQQQQYHRNTSPKANDFFGTTAPATSGASGSSSNAGTPRAAIPSLSPRLPQQGQNQASSYFSSNNQSSSTITATPSSQSQSQQAPSAPPDMRVLFVCASLFEFSIDKTRREAGYPYLTYVQGEVFDVVAQKGELWLAKNQDDAGNSLGWIWEQHFVILSQD